MLCVIMRKQLKAAFLTKKKDKNKNLKSRKTISPRQTLCIFIKISREKNKMRAKKSIIIIGTYVCNEYMYDVCIGTTHKHTHTHV